MEGGQALFIAMYGAFLGWIALSHIQQGKKIVATQTMLETLTNSVSRLTKMIDDLDTKLDLFLKNEIDTLKDIARSVKK